MTDPTPPLQSSRHTFLTLSRRAGCDTAVVIALTGHHPKQTSRVAQSDGLFSDEVLLREAQKVWDDVTSVHPFLNHDSSDRYDDSVYFSSVLYRDNRRTE